MLPPHIPRIRRGVGPITAEMWNAVCDWLDKLGLLSFAPPLYCDETVGFGVGIDLAQALSAGYPVSIDTSNFTTVNPSWTFKVASSTWTINYTTQLTESFVGGPINYQLNGNLFSFLGGPVLFQDYMQWGEVQVTWNADQNNYALPDACTFLNVNVTAANVNLTGIDADVVALAASEGRPLFISNRNISTGTLTLQNLNGGSLADNQLALADNADLVLRPGNGVALYYSANGTLWYMVDDRTSPGAVSVAVGATITPTGVPTLYRIPVPFGTWTAAATSQNVTLCTLAAKSAVLGAASGAWQSTKYAAPGLASANVSVGTTAVNFQDLVNGYSVFQVDPVAVATLAAGTVGSPAVGYSMAATQALTVRMVATGANVNTFTAGSVDILLLVYKLG